VDFFVTAVQVVLAYGSLILLIWAFVDALRFPKQDYQTVDRMPRVAWLIAIGFGFAMVFWLGGFRPQEPMGPRSFMWLASMILVAVYIYDMRPKLMNARLARER
jgi:hypothetical protein